MNYFSRHRVLGIALAVIVMLYFYACWIEPYWLEVTHHEVKAKVKSPLKICHLSDLHVRRFGRRERGVLEILEQEKPDVILISGDSMIRDASMKILQNVLRELHAPLGVWLVRGNWENVFHIKKEDAFYRDAGVKFLLNDAKPIRDDVWLLGFDDPSSGVPAPDRVLKMVPADVTKLALFHAPGFFHRIAGRIDLALAGHTHGGQIRLPFLPPLFLPAGCGHFVEGWYEEKASRLYVSRGVGTSILDMRFLARPEVAFITLMPQ